MIEKKENKTIVVSTKITPTQNEKLEKLTQKYGITKSNLINQLIEDGYKNITKNKNF